MAARGDERRSRSGFMARPRWRRLVLLLAACGCAAPSAAQVALPLNRPNESRPPIPDFQPPAVSRGRLLPPVEAEPEGLEAAAAGVAIAVTDYRFDGNSLISDAELSAIAQPYRGRRVTLAELKALRDLLTLAYINAGFITSGAELPEQTADDGIIEFRIVEGTLSHVEVTTDGRFDAEYLGRRIARPLSGRTVNVAEVENRLQLLLEDDRIDSVSAALVPDRRRGQAVLEARIQEARQWYLEAALANDLSPAIGGVGARLFGRLKNVSGSGDRLSGSVTYGGGFHELAADYRVPITAAQTLLLLEFVDNDSDIVDDKLQALDIESESRTFGVGIRHPFVHTLSHLFDASLRLEHRRSESSLLGRGFSFTPGPVDGVARVAVLRLGQHWIYRGENDVTAISSTLSVGLDGLGATSHDDERPDSQFVAWLLQAQWAHRFAAFDAQLLVRGDLQLSSEPLLALEQFSLGGAYSVRGYRENALVRDNGVLVSVELQIPLIEDRNGHSLNIVPLLDAGYGWNADDHPGRSETLVSVGAGVRWQYRDRLRARLYLVEQLRDVPIFGEHDLQDDGIGFALSMRWP